MTGVFSPLIVDFIGAGQFKLFLPLVYENKAFIITAHTGFLTDGASIPAVFHGIIGCPFGEAYTKAAVIHDALYRSALLSRKMSDYIFLEAMLSLGVDRPKARAMYLAVRAGGESSYRPSNVADARKYVEIKLKGA